MKFINKIYLQKSLLIFLIKAIGLSVMIVSSSSLSTSQSLGLKKLKTFDGYFKGYISPDGEKLALLDNAQIKVVKIPTGEKVCKIDIPPDPSDNSSFDSAAFFSNGSMLAVAFDSGLRETQKLSIDLWDVSRCKLTRTLANVPFRNNVGRNLSITSDGRNLALTVDVPRVWDLESGREIYRAPLSEDYIGQNSVLSPDGKWFAHYSERFVPPKTFNSLRITDMYRKDDKELSSERILSFVFTHDSSKLITFSSKPDKSGVSMRVYAVGSWKVLNDFSLKGIGSHASVSSDETLVAADDSAFYIISLKTGEILAEDLHYKRTKWDDLVGNMQMISFITHTELSPDGKMLLTGGEDGTVKLWKLSLKDK